MIAHEEMAAGRDVVVVGAGIAGLSAALHLAERGLRPLILEADPLYCGGRVAGGETVELGGWHFRGDHGVHAVWSPYHNFQAMLARHGIRPVFVPAQEEDWIYKRGELVRRAPVGSAIRDSWIPAPFHYLNLFLRPRFLGMLDFDDLLGMPAVWNSLMWGLGVDPLGEGQPLEGMWLSDLVGDWSPSMRALFVGLTRNGLSALPQEIPLSGFVAFLRFYTLLRRDAWNFAYLPADGGTCLAEPLAARVRALGATLAMGRRVQRLVPGESGWRVAWQAETGEGGAVRARHVILATDSPNASAIVENSPDLSPEAGDLYWPRGTATAAVRLWFDRAPWGGSEAGILSGDFTPDNFFWLHRIQDPYLRWHRATGGSALEVHIYGPQAVLDQPDAVVLARAIADVQSAFSELRGHQIHYELRRNPPTHTLLGVGPPGHHLGIETPWPGLYCCGDWVLHPSPAFFMERACVTGIEAANAVLRARDLPPWALLAPPPPEPLAAWIEGLMQRGRRALRRRRAKRSG
ncbi:MAG: FAD-dependent oxidoreductase [Anaerolineae bacterium]|jgi:predicted NAD/FAD-dependent oxidoreductase